MKKPDLRCLEEKNKAGVTFMGWGSQSADRRPPLVPPWCSRAAARTRTHSGEWPVTQVPRGTLMARDQVALSAGKVLWGDSTSTKAGHLGTVDTDLGSSAAQKQLSTQPCLLLGTM